MDDQEKAEDVLVKLERVFLCFGMADTDEQLQTALSNFLLPVLIELNSPAEGVRKKVMELLVHINKRLKSRPKIVLPVADLLKKFQDPSSSPFLINFTMLYIKMGYPRLPPEGQSSLIKDLFLCIPGNPAPMQNSFMQLVLLSLQHIVWPADKEKCLQVLNIADNPSGTQLLVDFCLNFLFLPYSDVVSEKPPPGLSRITYQRVQLDPMPSADQIEMIKLHILKLISQEILPVKKIVIHLVVAMADPRHSVSDCGEREFKRLVGPDDLNDAAIINDLFIGFQGSHILKQKKEPVKPEIQQTPGSMALRLKIFPLLLKSRKAAMFFPGNLQIVFESLFGMTPPHPKISLFAIKFVHHMCDVSVGDFSNASVLISGMLKVIKSENKQMDQTVRSLAYTAVGRLIVKAPTSRNDLSLLQTFIDMLDKETDDVKPSVHQALIMMASVYDISDAARQEKLESVVVSLVDQKHSRGQMVAVHFARIIFPATHVSSRFTLMLACGYGDTDIEKEARKCLRDAQTSPTFHEMILYISEKSKLKAKQSSSLPYSKLVYIEMLHYLRLCIAHEFSIEINELSIKETYQPNPKMSAAFQHLLDAEKSQKNSVMMYLDLLRQILTVYSATEAIFCILEVVAGARHNISSFYSKHLDWLKTFVYSMNEDTRVYASQLYGCILATCAESKSFNKTLQDLTAHLENSSIEKQHGVTLTLGYLLGFYQLNKQAQPADNFTQMASKAVGSIANLLWKEESLLHSAACLAIGEIGRVMPLDLTKQSRSKNQLVEKLLYMVKSTKVQDRVRESAALCLGLQCVGDPDHDMRDAIISGLLESSQAKQMELHFAIGDGLVLAALGVASAEARDTWLIEEKEFKPPVDADMLHLAQLIETLTEKYSISDNHHVRQAACIWLLSVVSKCSQFECFQSSIGKIQHTFMLLLADSNELTQDIASKGIGLVYESSSEEQKAALVDRLVETLTVGKKQKQMVTSSTQVFQEGAMGKTPDGKNLSTYQELCSLANDLNQPDLVYKFMHLANHNAIWNSRKGAAFGFTTIAAKAGEQLAPHYLKIVPRLYRYQFDPSPRVQQAMTAIWSALVPDSQKTVDKFIVEIFGELLVTLVHREWRVRESSCLACSDLLRCPSLDRVIDRFSELWVILFRVRDDIKESVRKAAEGTLSTLSRICVTMCNAENGKISMQMTKIVLPVLLNSGMQSSVAENRALSLSTILKISRSAKSMLKPHIPLLVPVLLKSLSELESSTLSYLSLHASAAGADQQEKLDSARIAASKTSPMMDGLKWCIQYVDSDGLDELVPRLIELVRGGVGLNTKAGCAHFLSSLIHHSGSSLTPHAAKLLAALLPQIHDKNLAISKCYAQVIGQLVKYAKSASVTKLLDKIRGWYMEKEEESVQMACCVTLQAIARKSSDVLKDHAEKALPLIFLGAHQSKTEGIDEWTEVLDEIAPVRASALLMNLSEVLEICFEALESPRFEMKAQGAVALAAVAKVLGTKLQQPHLRSVLCHLVTSLKGRIWKGKEKILEALCVVSISTKEELQKISKSKEDDVDLDVILDVFEKECTRGYVDYRLAALTCLSKILEEYGVNRFSQLQVIADKTINTKEEDQESESSKASSTKCQSITLDGLFRVWTVMPANDQKEHAGWYWSFLANVLTTAPVKIQSIALDSVTALLQSSNDAMNEVNTAEQLSAIVSPLCQCMSYFKHQSIMKKAVKVAEVLLHKLTDNGMLGILKSEDCDSIKSTLTDVLNHGDTSSQQSAQLLLKLFTPLSLH